MDFFDLFEHDFNYPKNVAEDGIPPETLYCYISDQFLNGFINYVKIIKSVMVERYCEDIEERKSSIENHKKDYHSQINALIDDVLIVAQTENYYWFFWYDKDSSDCCIGRFKKSKCSEKELIKMFDKMISSHDYFKGRVDEIKLKGWIS